MLGSISTAALLSLHLESVVRSLCVSDDQAVQTNRAMWLLYCIDKSYALRWQTFSVRFTCLSLASRIIADKWKTAGWRQFPSDYKSARKRT